MTITSNPVKKIVREMIKHEDELVNERLTWLGQFEGLLFIAYGLAVKDLNDPVLTWVVCLAGLLIAVSVLRATVRAETATGKLAEQWDTNEQSLRGDNWEPDVQGTRGTGNWLEKWSWPGRFLPALFALAWLTIAISQVVHFIATASPGLADPGTGALMGSWSLVGRPHRVCARSRVVRSSNNPIAQLR